MLHNLLHGSQAFARFTRLRADGNSKRRDAFLAAAVLRLHSCDFRLPLVEDGQSELNGWPDEIAGAGLALVRDSNAQRVEIAELFVRLKA